MGGTNLRAVRTRVLVAAALPVAVGCAWSTAAAVKAPRPTVVGFTRVAAINATGTSDDSSASATIRS